MGHEKGPRKGRRRAFQVPHPTNEHYKDRGLRCKGEAPPMCEMELGRWLQCGCNCYFSKKEPPLWRLSVLVFIGRGERIRTFDPLLPKQKQCVENKRLDDQLQTFRARARIGPRFLRMMVPVFALDPPPSPMIWLPVDPEAKRLSAGKSKPPLASIMRKGEASTQRASNRFLVGESYDEACSEVSVSSSGLKWSRSSGSESMYSSAVMSS